MKKFEVVRRYVDKNTLELKTEGSVVEYTDARAKELKEYLKPLKTTAKTDAKKVDESGEK